MVPGGTTPSSGADCHRQRGALSRNPRPARIRVSCRESRDFVRAALTSFASANNLVSLFFINSGVSMTRRFLTALSVALFLVAACSGGETPEDVAVDTLDVLDAVEDVLDSVDDAVVDVPQDLTDDAIDTSDGDAGGDSVEEFDFTMPWVPPAGAVAEMRRICRHGEDPRTESGLLRLDWSKASSGTSRRRPRIRCQDV